MPYDPKEDVFFWGTTFARDGHDYNPKYPTPAFSDAVRVLQRKGETFSVVFTGKMYKGRSKISGVSATVDLDSLKVLSRIKGRSTAWKVKKLLNLDEMPEHITGMYFHVLD